MNYIPVNIYFFYHINTFKQHNVLSVITRRRNNKHILILMALDRYEKQQTTHVLASAKQNTFNWSLAKVRFTFSCTVFSQLDGKPVNIILCQTKVIHSFGLLQQKQINLQKSVSFLEMSSLHQDQASKELSYHSSSLVGIL